jgi:heat shock protein HtpX
VAGTALLLILQPTRSAAMLRALFGAVRLTPAEAPGLYALIGELAGRAGLERPPSILYIPRPEPLAMSAGDGGEQTIALSDGILGLLPGRELGAVLAHEISHLRHGDLRILRLADTVGRLTRMLAMIGLFTLALYLPMAGAALVPLPALLLMIVAPLASDLLTLKLSRTREFDADAGAAELTGDPGALIAALARMERVQPAGWERMGKTPTWLSLIRTHPSTAERMERLEQLVPKPDHHWITVPDVVLPVLDRRPQAKRWPGPWGRPGSGPGLRFR